MAVMPKVEGHGEVPFGLRIFFRLAFLLLAAATLGLALSVLIEEKQRSYRGYAVSLKKSHAQVMARLRHPAGQLALLNPGVLERPVTPLRPVVLPFAALDFDDKNKAQQAIETAGCFVQYPDASSLCVAIGNNPYAGGFIYLVGSFLSGELVPLPQAEFDVSKAHRARVTVEMRGQTYRWIAPFQMLLDGTSVDPSRPGLRGRLTGYNEDLPIAAGTKAIRDFRGWLWQDGRCIEDAKNATSATNAQSCSKRSFMSIRLPIELFRDALATKEAVVWPPKDLAQIKVHAEFFDVGDKRIFDSNQVGASLPFSWAELSDLLLPGEQLSIRRSAKNIVDLTGLDDAPEPTVIPAWVDKLITTLPVLAVNTLGSAVDANAFVVKETLDTSLGRFDVSLKSDSRVVNKQLAAVTTRVSWFLMAMLLAIFLTWLAIELRVIRRVTVLTRRAASLAMSVKAADGISSVEFQDLKGRDELGLLSTSLQSLLQRVKEDVKKDQIRAEQEKDTWQAVGHEIMSPLQSLMVLHGDTKDPSNRYITRMQQAVKILYGQASPAEAFSQAVPELAAVNLNEFLHAVATNSSEIGILNVSYKAIGQVSSIHVKADEHWLEDVITHILNNANRFRRNASSIVIELEARDRQAIIKISNQGERIDPAMLERIFEFGVSSREDAQTHRGQGLFVARTYMAKMAGTISAANLGDSVCFELKLPLVS
jgi:signal transduction histidine kinase